MMQRYEMLDSRSGTSMVKRDNGEWVRAEDVEEELARLRDAGDISADSFGICEARADDAVNEARAVAARLREALDTHIGVGRALLDRLEKAEDDRDAAHSLLRVLAPVPGKPDLATVASHLDVAGQRDFWRALDTALAARGKKEDEHG